MRAYESMKAIKNETYEQDESKTHYCHRCIIIMRINHQSSSTGSLFDVSPLLASDRRCCSSGAIYRNSSACQASMEELSHINKFVEQGEFLNSDVVVEYQCGLHICIEIRAKKTKIHIHILACNIWHEALQWSST
jgi:hypothetical protein